MPIRFELRTLALLITIAAAMAIPAVATAGSPAEDLAWLNAKRSANGIPAAITLNPDWSANCAQHIGYMRATNTVSHPEDPQSPAYTDAGNWAGTHAVLASGLTWTEREFIWETAPLHMAQLLAPQLAQAGAADDGQFVCVTTWPGYTRPAPPVDGVVTYPGNGTRIYASEISAEWPTTPAEALGMSGPTGPHLYVYEWGPSATSGVSADGREIAIASATLTGPGGAVPVRWVDPRNPIVGQYLTPASGIIIPPAPLQPDTAYTATVRFTNGVSHAWGFTTHTTDDGAAISDVRITSRRVARPCTSRTTRHCAKRSSSGPRAVAIRGRYGATGGIAVRIRVGGYAVVTTRTTADGSFVATTTIRPRPRSANLLVTVDAGDDTAAYLVRLGAARRR